MRLGKLINLFIRRINIVTDLRDARGLRRGQPLLSSSRLCIGGPLAS